MPDRLPVTSHADGVRFAVHVQPNAARSEIVGLYGDALKIRLAAPPVDGAANETLITLLSHLLHRPKNAISIVRGGTARRKTVEVAGVSAESIRALIPEYERA